MFNKGFVKAVATLVVGTGLSQILLIIVSPILARLYTPETFGVLGLYIAIVAIASVISTGRYELAIILPESDHEASNLVAVAILLTLLFGLFIFIFVLLTCIIAPQMIEKYMPINIATLIPLGIVSTGIYQTLYYFFNRLERYKELASNKVLQSSVIGSSQVLFGLLRVIPINLVLGQILGQVVSVVFLLYTAFKRNLIDLKSISKTSMLRTAHRYLRFPKFLTLAHTINILSAQIPLILIQLLFSSTSAGYYLIIQRVLSAPISLFGTTVGDVFRQRASQEYTKNGNCRSAYLSTLKNLVLISIPLVIVLYFFIDQLFVVFFGNTWGEAVIYAKILLPLMVMRFISTPLSSMYLIAERQSTDLIWQVILLIAALSSFYVGNSHRSVILSLTLYSGSYCIMMLINLLMSYQLSTGLYFNSSIAISGKGSDK